MFGQLVQLFIEAGDVFRAIVIRQRLDAQLVQHLRSLGRRALLAIEGHDTPRDQVVFAKWIR